MIKNLQKVSAFSLLFILGGCAKMIPGFTDAIDDMVSDNAVEVNINKEAIQKDTDLQVHITVINKDPIVSK